MAEAKASKPDDMTSAEFYFDSNSHFGTHEELLKDRIRTRAFMRATLNNKHLFQNKVVLDVGSGTGILAMFAVKAGAKHVYGVESSGIIHMARNIVKKNGMSKKITLIKGKMEEVKLPVDKVDIILADWMGYMLLQESMLSTIIDARDRYLAKGGMIFPDQAKMYICGIEDAEYREQRINFWDNVYGFNMSCMKEGSLTEPLIDQCVPKQVITNNSLIHTIDLNTATLEAIKVSSEFQINATARDWCHALVLFFDVTFSKAHKVISFSTGPKEAYTHWKQSVLYLDEPFPLDIGESIKGTIKMEVSNGKTQKTIIDLKTNFKGKAAQMAQERVYKYG